MKRRTDIIREEISRLKLELAKLEEEERRAAIDAAGPRFATIAVTKWSHLECSGALDIEAAVYPVTDTPERLNAWKLTREIKVVELTDEITKAIKDNYKPPFEL